MSTQYLLKNEGIRDGLIRFIRELPMDPVYEVVIKEYEPKRSLAQNALFHVWMRELSDLWDETRGRRYSPAAWKLHFTHTYLGDDVVELPDGTSQVVVRGTSKLGVKKFAELLFHVEHDSVEMGITVSHTADYHLAMNGERFDGEKTTDAG